MITGPLDYESRDVVTAPEQSLNRVGLVSLDDPTFCSRLFTFLKLQIGRSLKDVADLDLAYIL